jgi:hydroxyacylglutathione hydrolase
MQQSLAKLTALPADTAVYCTHEYTMANIAFAEAVEPSNQALVDYKLWATQHREKQTPTLPSSIHRELAVNPFLRCHSAELVTSVSQNIGATLTSEQAIFASLRSWKDNF